MSADTITLGRVRARRRRLPRPPKFTNRQKLAIANDLVLIVIGLTSSALATVLLMIGATAGLHGTWMDATRRPLNALPSHLLSIAFMVAGVAVVLCTRY
jgi:hypothetical protein